MKMVKDAYVISCMGPPLEQEHTRENDGREATRIVEVNLYT